MKKIILSIILLTGMMLYSFAQPRSVGALVGATGAKLSYQHSTRTEQFVSIDAGVDLGYNVSGNPGAKVTGTYNFIWASPKWTKKGTWNIYAGPGVSTGWVEDRYVIKNGEERKNGYTHGFMLGITGLVGIEYNFTFPLQLSLEVRPCLGLHLAEKSASFYDNGLLGFIPSLGIRYAF